ncbi:MAG: hypothetical protein H0Z29_11140 [Candidatus Marinimicrobia bacterium]|nr:hypothetical protein [Candidatus Neomarinimicrobiota bacterium]
MKRLIIGTVPDDFDISKDILIGPWCCYNREKYLEHIEFLKIVPDPYQSSDDMKNDSDNIIRYINTLLPDLVKKLNVINNCQYSEKFWNIILKPWLLTLLHTTWEKQLRIEYVLKKFGNEIISIDIIKNDIEWDFIDSIDFLERGVLNPDYNEWLFSRLFEAIIPKKWKVSYIEKSVTLPLKTKKRIGLRNSLRSHLFHHFRCYGVYGIGLFNSILLSILLHNKPKIKIDYKEDKINEKNAIQLPWMIDIMWLIEKTMPLRFRNIENTNKRKFKEGKIRLIGPLLFWNEDDKFELACAVENGEHLVCTQHGGNCGISKVYSFPAEFEYNHLAFFSWGWEEQEDYGGNIIPLPSPYLIKFKRKSFGNKSKLLLVSTREYIFPYRLASVPQPLERIKSRKHKIDFLNNLDSNVFHNTIFYSYPNESGALNNYNYFRIKFKDLMIKNGRLHQDMMKAKLIVLDHPGTTLNISLSANIPTIGFWDKNSWSLCRQATQIFDRLEKVGIIFSSGEQAAFKVNEVWNNIEAWWSQEEIQMAVREWCQKYALTNRCWLWKWIKTLWKL